MIDLTRLFDSYNRQARLYPALLSLLPLLLMLLAWFPAFADVGHLLIAVAMACGLLFLFSDIARTRGKKLEPILLREWGGWPTTIWLRHSDNNLSAEVTGRYHAFFARQLAIGAMPTPIEEEQEPAAADKRYAASVVWLKERCRGETFSLVEKENATYGFRRNMLGLKSIGLAICIITLLGPLVIASIRIKFHVSNFIGFLFDTYLNLPIPVFGALAFSTIMLIVWIFIVDRGWVREAGDQYARALLANCDSLAT